MLSGLRYHFRLAKQEIASLYGSKRDRRVRLAELTVSRDTANCLLNEKRDLKKKVINTHNCSTLFA